MNEYADGQPSAIRVKANAHGDIRRPTSPKADRRHREVKVTVDRSARPLALQRRVAAIGLLLAVAALATLAQ